MGTQQDAQIGLAAESTYGVGVTPTAFPEFTEEDLDYTPEYVQGAGMRVGKRMDRGDRRSVGKISVGGSFTVESYTKGLGKLFQAALGTGTSTLIAGTAYQQVFTPTTTDYLSSYTIQKGLPTLGGGAASPQTYTGMVCSGFEASFVNGGIPTFKFNWAGKNVTTATALATAAYPANTKLLTFVNASLSIGGSITPPTTNALAVAGTNSVNVREADFTWDNALDEEGYTFGSGGTRARPPALGLRTGTGSITAEYTSEILRDAFVAQTPLNLVLTYALTGAGNLISGSSYPTIQFVIPQLYLEGEMPKTSGGEVVTQSIPFSVLDDGTTAHPFYVVIVTAETAI